VLLPRVELGELASTIFYLGMTLADPSYFDLTQNASAYEVNEFERTLVRDHGAPPRRRQMACLRESAVAARSSPATVASASVDISSPRACITAIPVSTPPHNYNTTCGSTLPGFVHHLGIHHGELPKRD
jgi:hypothetical protein